MTAPMPSSIFIYVRSISGGAGKNAVKYANILARAGHNVVLTCGQAPAVGQFIPDAAVRLHIFDTRRNLSAVPHLRRILTRDAPDICLVVDASNLPAMLLALPAHPRRPHLILREALSTWQRLQTRGPVMRHIKAIIHALGYRRCDHVIALTQEMRRELVSQWGVQEVKISLIPNGIAVPEMPMNVPDKGRRIVLCVSRLEDQKDISTLLKAFSIVRKTVDCDLVIAGEGRLRSILGAQAKALGIADHVDFRGHVSDTAPLYAKAEVVVLSSLWEGFPNVIIEALAQAIPVVATSTPGAVEILQGGDCGLLSKMADPDDLAAKLVQALSQPWDRGALIARARNYSDDRLTQRVVALFKRIDEIADKGKEGGLPKT